MKQNSSCVVSCMDDFRIDLDCKMIKEEPIGAKSESVALNKILQSRN